MSRVGFAMETRILLIRCIGAATSMKRYAPPIIIQFCRHKIMKVDDGEKCSW